MAYIQEGKVKEPWYFTRAFQWLIREQIDEQKALEHFRSLEMIAIELDSYGEEEWAQELLATIDKLLAELNLESDYRNSYYRQGQ
jgi:hypothetical protein